MSEQDLIYAKEKELRSLEIKVVELEHENKALKACSEKNLVDHKDYEKRFNAIDINQGVISNTLSAVVNSVNELRVDIKTRDNDSIKSYNNFKWALVLSIVTTIVGFFVNLAN